MAWHSGDIAAIAHALGGARKSGNGWVCRCPAHDDKHASLSLNIGADGKPLWKCHAGCAQDAVTVEINALGARQGHKPKANGHAAPERQTQQRRTINTAYDYRDEAGNQIYQNVRFSPKGFALRRPARSGDNPERVRGGWAWTADGIRRVPYRLPELLAGIAAKATIWITEGEKDADRLASEGLIATTNEAGAGNWREEHASFLKGAEVVIVEDTDDAGRERTVKVGRSLLRIATSIKVVRFPDLPPHGDVSDWLDQGGSVERLCEIAGEAPEWNPATNALEFDDEVELTTAVDAIVKGIIHPGDTGAIYGPSGVGKTFIAVDMAYHVALGHDWQDISVRKMPVLYVALEGVRGMRHRMLAAREYLGSAGRFFARLKLAVQLDRSEAGAAGQATIIEQALLLGTIAGTPVGLIIIDTVARAMAGDDESSTQDMNAFTARMKAIATETGAFVLGVHHPGKDDTRGMRGAYALTANVDVVLKVEPAGDARRVITEKVRDGVVGQLFGYVLNQVTLGTDDDGDAITSCVVAKAEIGEHAPRGRPPGSPRHAKGLRALEMALSEVGQTPPSMLDLGRRPPPEVEWPEGSGAQVVTIDQWKAYAVPLNVCDRELPTKRQNEQLRRVLDALVAKKIVGQWEDYVWKIN